MPTTNKNNILSSLMEGSRTLFNRMMSTQGGRITLGIGAALSAYFVVLPLISMIQTIITAITLGAAAFTAYRVGVGSEFAATRTAFKKGHYISGTMAALSVMGNFITTASSTIMQKIKSLRAPQEAQIKTSQPTIKTADSSNDTLTAMLTKGWLLMSSPTAGKPSTTGSKKKQPSGPIARKKPLSLKLKTKK